MSHIPDARVAAVVASAASARQPLAGRWRRATSPRNPALRQAFAGRWPLSEFPIGVRCPRGFVADAYDRHTDSGLCEVENHFGDCSLRSRVAATISNNRHVVHAKPEASGLEHVRQQSGRLDVDAEEGRLVSYDVGTTGASTEATLQSCEVLIHRPKIVTDEPRIDASETTRMAKCCVRDLLRQSTNGSEPTNGVKVMLVDIGALRAARNHSTLDPLEITVAAINESSEG